MDFRDIQKEAKKQGWTFEKLGSGHWRFVPPDPTQDSGPRVRDSVRFPIY